MVVGTSAIASPAWTTRLERWSSGSMRSSPLCSRHFGQRSSWNDRPGWAACCRRRPRGCGSVARPGAEAVGRHLPVRLHGHAHRGGARPGWRAHPRRSVGVAGTDAKGLRAALLKGSPHEVPARRHDAHRLQVSPMLLGTASVPSHQRRVGLPLATSVGPHRAPGHGRGTASRPARKRLRGRQQTSIRWWRFGKAWPA